MSKRVQQAHQRRVVIAVVSNFPRDTRVHKTAETLARAGHHVTVAWCHHDLKRPVTRDHGEWDSIGKPLPYTRRRQVMRDHLIAPTPPFKVVGRRGALPLLRAVARWAANRANGAYIARAERRDTADRRAKQLHRATLADIDATLRPVITSLEPSVLHLQDVHVLPLGSRLRGTSWRRRRRVDVLIYDAHEYVGGQVLSSASESMMWARSERRAIRRCDAVTTVSPGIATRLADDHSLKTTPTVILNAADVPGRPCPHSVRESAGVRDSAPLVVYSGGIAAHRGVDVLVNCLVHLPQVHLAIVPVPSASTPAALKLKTLAESLGVDDRVHLVEPVAPDQVVEFLRGADIGAHPLREGPINHELALPNKLFDYLHADLGIVTSQARTMATFVTDHRLGASFEGQNPEQCAQAIRTTLDARTNGTLGTHNPDLLREYQWSAQAAHLIELYEGFDT